MAITVKYLEDLGVEKDVAQQIFAERGKEIAEMNNTKSELEKQVSEYKASYDKLNSELETLKSNSASGVDWEAKFNEFKAEVEKKEAEAEQARMEKEKAETNRMLFEKAVTEYGKKEDDWCNEFTRDGYMAKFVEAIGAEENAGKSHKEIFKNLVKDDGTVWKGVQQIPLAGGKPHITDPARSNEDRARAVMGLPIQK